MAETPTTPSAQAHRKRDERHRFVADPEVDALVELLKDGRANGGQSAEVMARLRPKAKAAKDRMYKEKATRRVIAVEKALPGMAPSPFDPRGISPKERHAQTDRAIERARGAIDLVFDFTENLIRAGDEVVTKIRHGKEVSEAESKVVGEARQAANKLLDKTVPDIMTEGTKGGMVHINFGAPLARLMQPTPTSIEITPEDPTTSTPAEDTNGSAGD